MTHLAGAEGKSLICHGDLTSHGRTVMKTDCRAPTMSKEHIESHFSFIGWRSSVIHLIFPFPLTCLQESVRSMSTGGLLDPDPSQSPVRQ